VKRTLISYFLVAICAIPLSIGLASMGIFKTEAVAAEQKVYHWKFSSHTGAGNKSLAPWQLWYREQIEKRSNGRIQVKMYWTDELCGPKEMMMAVKSRLADIVGHTPSYTPGETPISNATYLPFLPPPRLDQAVVTYNRAFTELKPFVDELKKFNCVYCGAYESGSYNLMGKKPVRTVNDLKGLRVRCMPDLGEVLKQFGAVPMTTPVTEMYSALDTGIVDVVAHSRVAFNAYKVDEISKYVTLDMDMGYAPTLHFMNRDTLNELPDDLKKVVQSVIDDSPAFMWDLWYEPTRMAKADKVIQDRAMEITRFPKAERDKLVAKAELVWEAWAKRSGNYEVAKQALADFIRIRDEVVAKYPQGVPGIKYNK
jgi:TRAP-type C4-dicarboxylate transport system substrate-binding protein